MIEILKTVAPFLLVFAALSFAGAVMICRRVAPPADPFLHPFGEMPNVPNPGVAATPPGAGSGASSIPSDAAAARVAFYRRDRRAF